MTISKTKLVKVNRKFSLKRSDVEKAMLEVYAELGVELPKKRKVIKASKTKA
jgi:hypothetical protein